MTDLVDRLRDAAYQAGQAAQPPAFESLKLRARSRQHRRVRAVAATGAALIAILVVATLTWPPTSAPPADDRRRPPDVSNDRFLRKSDFYQPTFQAVEDDRGDQAGHPNCSGIDSGPGRTVQWREFRTFEQAVRGYQLVSSFSDSGAAHRAIRLVENCAGMLTGDSEITSELTDARGDSWRVRRRVAPPRLTEVFAVTRVGNVVAAVWVQGLHRVVATDSYAQVLLERMRARLAGTSARFSTLPPGPLSAAMLTKADARTIAGRTLLQARHPAVFQSIHTCGPVPHFVNRWRHVHYQRRDGQPLLDERVSIAADTGAARRSWQRLVADITGCDTTRERVLPGPRLGDEGVLITDPDDPSSPTAVVRIGRVVVEVVLWDSNLRAGQTPSSAQIPDFVTIALDRIRAHLPEESAGD